MPVYSIKDLERYSGIKAHTLRIWEQRYNLLSPHRTDTNIRAYTNADLKHLLNVSFLNNQGIKISNIAKLTPKEICDLVNKVSESAVSIENQSEHLIAAMISYDEEKFEQTFDFCCKKIGFDKTITEVIYPFLKNLGMMWHTGIATPGQEHFIVNLIRQKLILASDKTPAPSNPNASKFLLYLPENEFHEVGLLYYNYLLKTQGNYTYYLGQSVPYEDLIKSSKQIKPNFLVTIITCPKEVLDGQEYVLKLGKDFPSSTIFISGSEDNLASLHYPKNIHLFKNPNHFLALLKKK